MADQDQRVSTLEEPEWVRLIRQNLKRNRGKMPKGTAVQVQLATVDDQGWPCARTMVFRGFESDLAAYIRDDEAEHLGKPLSKVRLLFASRDDATKVQHSKKFIDEMDRSMRVEVCWWFSGTNNQFRIRGRIHLWRSNDRSAAKELRRVALWRLLSPLSRAVYIHPYKNRTLGPSSTAEEIKSHDASATGDGNTLPTELHDLTDPPPRPHRGNQHKPDSDDDAEDTGDVVREEGEDNPRIAEKLQAQNISEERHREVHDYTLDLFTGYVIEPLVVDHVVLTPPSHHIHKWSYEHQRWDIYESA
eukprot:Clim_evm7s108 gene=Clim_evmTU7s108